MADTRNMWQALAEQQAEFIGGRLIEHDCHTGSLETRITGMAFEQPYDGGQCFFSVTGAEFDMTMDIRYIALKARGHDVPGFTIIGSFGSLWEVVPPTEVERD